MSGARGGEGRGGGRAGGRPDASLSPGSLPTGPRLMGEGRLALGGRGRVRAAACELSVSLFFGGGGRGKKEGAAAGNFSVGPRFFWRGRWENSSFSRAGSHMEPRAAVCKVGARGDRGVPAVL